MPDFDQIFAPGRGTCGELRAYCAENAQLLKDSVDLQGKAMILPAEVLKAPQLAP